MRSWYHGPSVNFSLREFNSDFLDVIQLDDKIIPREYCCIKDEQQVNRGLVGQFYNVSSAPVVVLDSRTILIPQFSFEGTRPPVVLKDAWIFAGKGHVDKGSGKQSLIVAKDTPQHHCPLTKDYSGNTDLKILLPRQQTVYDINYISVFCYEYAVDFGHVYFDLSPQDVPVPPYIPPIQNEPSTVIPIIPC
uniref:DM13 domain-containing protein n=1 Tax=Setaria digitata TaxID=48799 RepID=A0A915Q263_9BILA